MQVNLFVKSPEGHVVNVTVYDQSPKHSIDRIRGNIYERRTDPEGKTRKVLVGNTGPDSVWLKRSKHNK